MKQESTEKPKRWVQAPQPTGPASRNEAVTGVRVSGGEDVQWLWTHVGGGSYVSGYTIVDKKAPKRGHH